MIPCCCISSVVHLELADPGQEADLVAQLGQRLGEVEKAPTAAATLGRRRQAQHRRPISLKMTFRDIDIMSD